MWLDSKLSWKEHIDKIVNKCKRVLNIMKCMAGQEWGADRRALKTVYIAMIRSVLDYGSMAYGLAAKCHLVKLDRIQAQALRICCGAYITTPIASLQVEANEMPLDIRRQQLMAVYWSNLKSQDAVHPTKKVIESCWEQGLMRYKSFGSTVTGLISEMGLYEYKCFARVIHPHIPLWIIPCPKVDLTLLEMREKDGDKAMEVIRAREYINIKYGNNTLIFTDASRSGGRVGVAVYVPKIQMKKKVRITDQLAVYTGEMMAILLAVQMIKEIEIREAVICSDSSSALVSISNHQSKTRPDLVTGIL
ncbi:RNA-directed DNA polymerase from mobile element jockey [Labeo rohita]|uniref:RNA-directed DNA polymerase from mobile element jockey n=1 Tax=Labeo rohita TaxID=84645 RepID=A0ABQ8L9N2_LABRO|nr:RNA-directed DNA polymerase from mobile element jockey [Labeo rohita]